MKSFLLLILMLATFPLFSQVPAVIPHEASSFYGKAMKIIKSELKNLVEKNALSLKNNNVDSLTRALKQKDGLSKLNANELNAISVLILVKASENADSDLKELVLSNKSHSFDQALSDKTNDILSYKSDIAKSINVLIGKISPLGDKVLLNLR